MENITKYSVYARNSFKNKNVLEENYQETLKKTNRFFPLHLVSFHGQDYEEQKAPRARY